MKKFSILLILCASFFSACVRSNINSNQASSLLEIKTTTPTTSTTTPTGIKVTKDWKLGEIKSENLVFDYPQDWKLYTPSFDKNAFNENVQLVHGNGFLINFLIVKTGSSYEKTKSSCADCGTFTPIDHFTINKDVIYIIRDVNETSNLARLYMSSCPQQECLLKTPYIGGKINAYLMYIKPGTTDMQSVDTFNSDVPDVQTFIDVAKSLRFRLVTH